MLFICILLATLSRSVFVELPSTGFGPLNNDCYLINNLYLKRLYLKCQLNVFVSLRRVKMKDISAKDIINTLNLTKHPEGGWYCETYRSVESIESERGSRSLATAIYFMLQGSEKSAFHRLKSDEFWYFHQGSSLRVHVISADGTYKLHFLGLIGDKFANPQLLLPAGCWFAAECQTQESYSLVSCSVHPGFDFADFELAKVEELNSLYPQHSELISEFCIQ